MTNEATEAQNRAADPGGSTWLAANAGSGKTRVLTDRVARLLLGGTDPQRILCLTFTTAAASEMQNRLFRRLGRWAMLDERALYAELKELGVAGPIGSGRLAEARRLFARAIEAPGGLKIQTIHSFCAGLLRHFPLEARVSPDFAALDDRTAIMIRRQVLEEMAAGADRAAVEAMARLDIETRTDRFLTDIARLAEDVRHTGCEPPLAQALGVDGDLDEAGLLARVFLGGEADLLSALAAIMLDGGPTDSRAGRRLDRLARAPMDIDSLGTLEDLLLTGSGAASPFAAKVGSFPTKALVKARGAEVTPLLARLEPLMLRVEAARPLRLGLKALRKSQMLYRFARPFLDRYAARKAARGMLDFDDIITRAAALLSDPAVAPWVLFRLDGGIDHILVDEAQDTSPGQWQVIERLAEEFTAGEGARGQVRTLFVVGDRKQSIYSFQGANVETFGRMQRSFSDRHLQAGLALQDLSLLHSFRSSPAILQAVDAAFAGQSVAGLGGATCHVAFHDDLPGRVDLWDIIPKTARPDLPHWSETGTVAQEPQAHDMLARRIAGWIAATIRARTPIIEKKEGRSLQRPLHAGDFLILVRRRSALFHAIIRACKSEGLDIAGADRLKLGEELAVRDILALLSFLALPEDDLSLAAVLRSPLLGWSEDALFRLAHGRDDTTFLWQALRGDEGHAATLAVLDDLRSAADYLRPYELIERILTRHEGRRRLLARLGREAEDGIDALLAEALAFEQTSVPGLTAFLVWMEGDDVEIKRRPDGSGRAIRVMTVHGAKGLEAPVVILPDCAAVSDSRQQTMIRTADGMPLWRVRKDEAPPAMARSREAEIESEREERRRLLYVAMTRAANWLVVCAAGDAGKDGDSWYSQVEAAMDRLGAALNPPGATQWDFGTGRRFARGTWPAHRLDRSAGEEAAAPESVPLWAQSPLGSGPQREAILSPSALGGAKALAGEGGQDEAAALRHGTLVHRLLEVLPALDPDQWQGAAQALGGDGAGTAMAEARAVIEAPHLAEVFAPSGLAEVELAAPLAALGGRMAQGTIDRLVVGPDRVLAVDFKTNAVVPASADQVPEGILRQLGAYAEMLAPIWPDRRIDLAIVWTRTALFMPIPLNIVRQALQATTVP